MERVETATFNIGPVQVGKGLQRIRTLLEKFKSLKESEICQTAEILGKISTVEVGAVSDVCGLVGGILLMQGDPTPDVEMIAKADVGFRVVLISKTAITAATIIIGMQMAGAALLKLSGSEARMPSIKTFATLVNIPKGYVAIYSLYHTTVTRGGQEETTEAKERRMARYGKRFMKAVTEEQKSAALRKNAVDAGLSTTVVAGILTNFVLDTLGYHQVAKWVDHVTMGVLFFKTAIDAHDIVTDKDNQKTAKDFLKKLRERCVPPKLRQFWTGSSAG